MQEQEWTPATVQDTPDAKPITLWRRHMDNAMAGLVMHLFTLNFPGLNTLLPVIGTILMLLGFRGLRQKSRRFRACYYLTLAEALIRFFLLAVDATVCHETFNASSLYTIIGYGSAALTFILLFCLRAGFREAQQQMDITPHTGPVTSLTVFLLLGLVNAHFNGIIAIGFMIALIIIIRNMFRLTRELDEAGYTVEPAPIRIPDGKLAGGIAVVLLAGITCGYLFLHRYPMEWTAVDSAEHAEAAEIKAHLLELGFPEQVLNDLTAGDILACEGALRVAVQTRDHPVNDGREVTERLYVGSHTYTVYDVKELRITGVAVQLPGEQEQWKLFHHFLWTVDPGFYGTEALQLWPAYRDRSFNGWGREDSGFTGRVLYDENGTTYAAPYHSLSRDTYTADSVFWGSSQQTDLFAAFSMPGDGEAHRGYVSYGIEEFQDGSIVDSWLNYVHRDSWFQYPVQTAKEYRMNGGMFSRGAFRVVQDALQFYPTEDTVELIGE